MLVVCGGQVGRQAFKGWWFVLKAKGGAARYRGQMELDNVDLYCERMALYRQTVDESLGTRRRL